MISQSLYFVENSTRNSAETVPVLQSTNTQKSGKVSCTGLMLHKKRTMVLD
jgi:hypothetical protein